MLLVTHIVLLLVDSLALPLFFCFTTFLPVELLLPLPEVLKLDSVLFSFFHLSLVLRLINVSLHHLFFILLVRPQEIALAQFLILISVLLQIRLFHLIFRALMLMAVLHL